MGENKNVSETDQHTVDTNAGDEAVQGTVAEADTSEVDDNIKAIAEDAGYEKVEYDEPAPEQQPSQE